MKKEIRTILRIKPFFLTFLIFLQTLSDDGEGVSAALYGEPCEIYSDCPETGFCHRMNKQCDCVEAPRSKTGAIIVQVFDEKRRRCLSPVGGVCLTDDFTIKQDDDGYVFNCVPNSNCVRSNAKTAARFGVCECALNYEKGYNSLCEKIEEKVVLGQVWSSMGNVQGDSPKASKLGDDNTNENNNIIVTEDKLHQLAESEKGAAIVSRLSVTLIFISGLFLIAFW